MRKLLVLSIALLVTQAACSSSDDSSSTGATGVSAGGSTGTAGSAGGGEGGSAGSSAAGSSQGGSSGSSAGGSNAGGSNAGGSNAGGSNAGGSNAGGSNAGGSNAGGSNAGGMNAGGSSAGGTCESYTACGGDLVGTWTFSGMCAQLAPGTDPFQGKCPAAKLSIDASIAGTITFAADGSYTKALTTMTTVHATVPKTCTGGSCPAPKPGQTVMDKGDSCELTNTNMSSDAKPGTYSTTATTLTSTDQGDTTSTTSEYCVMGNVGHAWQTTKDGVKITYTISK